MSEDDYWKDFNICQSCIFEFERQAPKEQVTSTGPWTRWKVQLLPSPLGIKPPRPYAEEEDLARPIMKYHQLTFRGLTGHPTRQATCMFVLPAGEVEPICDGFFYWSVVPQTEAGIPNCVIQEGLIRLLPEGIESSWDLLETATVPTEAAQVLTIDDFASTLFNWFVGKIGFEVMPKGTNPPHKILPQPRYLDDEAEVYNIQTEYGMYTTRTPPDAEAMRYPGCRGARPFKIRKHTGSRTHQLTPDELDRAAGHMSHLVLSPRAEQADFQKVFDLIEAQGPAVRRYWRLKSIDWNQSGHAGHGQRVHVLVDHEGGPCSLQVLVNVLILRDLIHLNPSQDVISLNQIRSKLSDYLRSQRIPPAYLPDGSPAQSDLPMSFFHAVLPLIPVMTQQPHFDVGFESLWAIEDSRRSGALGVLELSGVRVCHGRLPGPDDEGYQTLMMVKFVSQAGLLAARCDEAQSRGEELTEEERRHAALLRRFLDFTNDHHVTEKGRQALEHYLPVNSIEAFWNERALRVIHHRAESADADPSTDRLTNLYELVFESNGDATWKRVEYISQPAVNGSIG